MRRLFLWIELLISIEKNQPLITSNKYCSALQLGLYPTMDENQSTELNRKTTKLLTLEYSNQLQQDTRGHWLSCVGILDQTYACG